MITIIEHGKTHFEKTCDRCGCKFTYDLEDLSYVDTIRCPECDNKLYHSTPSINSLDIIYTNDYEKTNGTYYNPATRVEI